ncbi:MAG: futalosine hydrolase [Planctomycetes bacterium]|nr:futalosine hydrolase [Planctomycetota bacterium]
MTSPGPIPDSPPSSELPAPVARATGSAERRTVLLLTAVEREMAPLRRRRAALEAFCAPRLVVTGPGKISAACETALALREHVPALAVQVGCAGAYAGAGLRVGDVVVSDLEVLADEGAEAPGGFLDLERLGLPAGRDGDAPVYNQVRLSRPRPETWRAVLERAAGRFEVRLGRTATVSTVSATEERARSIAARWDPLAESMEGAAGALVALRLGCPFLEVRGISNLVGPRDRAAWDIDAACEHAAEVAVAVVAAELEAAAGQGTREAAIPSEEHRGEAGGRRP